MDKRKEEMVIQISVTKLQVVLPKILHKAILPFVGAYMEQQAKGWINSFNTTSKYKLQLAYKVINSLYVVTIKESEGGSKKKLLRHTRRWVTIL